MELAIYSKDADQSEVYAGLTDADMSYLFPDGTPSVKRIKIIAFDDYLEFRASGDGMRVSERVVRRGREPVCVVRQRVPRRLTPSGIQQVKGMPDFDGATPIIKVVPPEPIAVRQRRKLVELGPQDIADLSVRFREMLQANSWITLELTGDERIFRLVRTVTEEIG